MLTEVKEYLVQSKLCICIYIYIYIHIYTLQEAHSVLLGVELSTANGIGSNDFNVKSQVDYFVLTFFNSQSMKFFFSIMELNW